MHKLEKYIPLYQAADYLDGTQADLTDDIWLMGATLERIDDTAHLLSTRSGKTLDEYIDHRVSDKHGINEKLGVSQDAVEIALRGLMGVLGNYQQLLAEQVNELLEQRRELFVVKADDEFERPTSVTLDDAIPPRLKLKIGERILTATNYGWFVDTTCMDEHERSRIFQGGEQ
jgi:hypothetical protein